MIPYIYDNERVKSGMQTPYQLLADWSVHKVRDVWRIGGMVVPSVFLHYAGDLRVRV